MKTFKGIISIKRYVKIVFDSKLKLAALQIANVLNCNDDQGHKKCFTV